MPVVTISNPKVRIIPSNELVLFIVENSEFKKELAKALESRNYEKSAYIKQLTSKESQNLKESEKYFYLKDFYCLKDVLQQMRPNNKCEKYVHELLAKCTVVLPKNDYIPRDEALEARCKKLRAEQANVEYMNITKNVDLNIKHKYEDSFAFQLKEVNRQIIAVIQFVCSVVAGFVFGFLGIELIVGNLDFGFRLLLGIMFALIIALAEIYFLAKKLNECDEVFVSKVKQD